MSVILSPKGIRGVLPDTKNQKMKKIIKTSQNQNKIKKKKKMIKNIKN